MVMLQERMNAALAIATGAKGSIVRIAVIYACW